jgi:7,8-dihydroneopterin aldolase/epimerase/oxygenase
VPDAIQLRGLEVFAHHGVFPDEQKTGQPFLIDVDIRADLSVAGGSDRLEDTVDYGAMAIAVHEAVSSERWDLIERVAQRVAEVVLSLDERIEVVSVTVHKPHAPIPRTFTDVSVTIERTR